MLTKEENERFTRVGPGTPAGDLLRRYWHPVAVRGDLSAEQPTRFVRILGEDLVLFRDTSGRVGLLADHCSHRGASLLYGRVEERGIACAYHGWLYDVHGNCLECPAEPSGSMFHLTVKHRAYPVQEFIGLYWAYLGPEPAPLIPRYDIWVRKDGRRRIEVHPRIDCNWYQAMENSVDPAHLAILHQEHANFRGRTVTSASAGFIRSVERVDIFPFEHGVMKRRVYTSGIVDEHPVLFPTILRINNSAEIRVPIDDTHLLNFEVFFDPTEDGRISDDRDEIPVTYLRPFKDPPDALHPFTRFRWDAIAAQDAAAWETQGPVSDREHERLATSDRGLLVLRQMMRENIDRVAAGLDPIGVMRDPQHDMIDTKLAESLEYVRRRGEAKALRLNSERLRTAR